MIGPIIAVYSFGAFVATVLGAFYCFELFKWRGEKDLRWFVSRNFLLLGFLWPVALFVVGGIAVGLDVLEMASARRDKKMAQLKEDLKEAEECLRKAEGRRKA